MAEKKTRIHTRITAETERKIAAAMPLYNCQTQNEFVEKALQFYCVYAVSQDAFFVLPPMLVSALRTTVQGWVWRYEHVKFFDRMVIFWSAVINKNIS